MFCWLAAVKELNYSHLITLIKAKFCFGFVSTSPSHLLHAWSQVFHIVVLYFRTHVYRIFIIKILCIRYLVHCLCALDEHTVPKCHKLKVLF